MGHASDRVNAEGLDGSGSAMLCLLFMLLAVPRWRRALTRPRRTLGKRSLARLQRCAPALLRRQRRSAQGGVRLLCSAVAWLTLALSPPDWSARQPEPRESHARGSFCSGEGRASAGVTRPEARCGEMLAIMPRATASAGVMPPAGSEKDVAPLSNVQEWCDAGQDLQTVSPHQDEARTNTPPPPGGRLHWESAPQRRKHH